MPDKLRMAILDDYQKVSLKLADWREIRGRIDVTVFPQRLPQDHLVEVLRPFDILFVMRERTILDAATIAALPKLKMIATVGAVNAAIDVTACEARGIVVSGTGYTNHATAELTWALILAAARNIVDEANSVRSGGWQTGLGSQLHGKTLGVIGLGGVGSLVARVGLAFGMKVIAWSQNMTEERAEAVGAALVTKDMLCRTADVVTVHLRMSERTRNLIDGPEIDLMKTSAIIINTSRGPLVNEAALTAALSAGKIAAAGIDVFDREPLPQDHSFRSLDRLVATPHIGSVSKDLYELFFAQTVENVSAWLSQAPIRIVSSDPGSNTANFPAWVSAASPN